MPASFRILAAVALAAITAADASAQRPASGVDRGAFVILLGADTFAVEPFARAAGRVDGSLEIRGSGARLGYAIVSGADARVSSVRLEQRITGAPASAPPASAGEFTFAGDTIVAAVGGQTERMAVRAGTLPWINPSIQFAEQMVRRADAVRGARVTLPVVGLAGGEQFDAVVTRTADSATLAFSGVEMRFAVDARGRLTGGAIPAQNIRIVRLDSAQAAALAPAASAPPSPSTSVRKDAPSDASSPVPYTSEDVTVRVPAGHVLTGTLTLPRGVRRAPAVVTLSGSGPQDRDGGISVIPGYRPFRQIADTLARRGIAVLRLDDRGVGSSGGVHASVTSEDLADDARAALAFLRARADIDPARLALVGHSEGGMVAPMVAATDGALRAVVLMAAPARRGRDISIMQQRQAFAKAMPDSTPAAREAAFARNLALADSMAATIPWVRFWFAYDPIPTARRVRQPVLVLQGETDMQVTPEQAGELAAAIRAGGNRDVSVRTFPATNHLFLADPDGDAGPQGSRYATLPSKDVPPAVLGALADWLATKLR